MGIRVFSLVLVVFFIVQISLVQAVHPKEIPEYWVQLGETQIGRDTSNEDEEDTFSFESVQKLLNRAIEAQQAKFISSTEAIRELVEREMQAIVASPSKVPAVPASRKNQ